MGKKYKYLKITGDLIYGKTEITKQDLVHTKNQTIDCLIDIDKGKYYDAEKNDWQDIKGE